MAADVRPVRILVLGEPERGDDGAAFAAVPLALAELSPLVRRRLDVRRTGQLDPLDLIDLPTDGWAIVVDAVCGVRPGRIVSLPLGDLTTDRIRPRSTHLLPVEELIAMAGLVRGAAIPGVFVGVGVSATGLGDGLSPVVSDALPDLVGAIVEEVVRRVGAPVLVGL